MSDDVIIDSDNDSGDSGTDDVIAGASVLGKRGSAVSSASRLVRPPSALSRLGNPDISVFEADTTATPRPATDDYTWLNDAQNKQSLCRSCNQCPICKMPINVNPMQADPSITADMNWDLRWRGVQAWFKSKPAICLDDTKRNRNIQAFGIVPGIGKRTEASNKCHYLHTSASGGGADFNGIWALCDGPDGVTILKEPFNGFKNEIARDTGFLNKLIHIGSMFNTIANLTTGFLFDPNHVNTPHLNAVITTMTSKTFAGCWDCNQKMTQMNFVKPLFDAQFGTVLKIKKRDVKLNVKMNYLLLSMQLKTENVIDTANGAPISMVSGSNTEYAYTITPAMQPVWKFKLGIAWCLMMIVFSHWNARKLNPKFRHHEIYILNGSADFYLSLLLYLVYRANYPGTGGGTPLEFEEFHFFYANNFIFWLKFENYVTELNPPIGGNSMSLAIHHLNAMGTPWTEVEILDIPDFDEKNPMGTASAALKQVYEKTTQFVQMFFQEFCEQLYGVWGTDDANGYSDYFASPATVKAIITDMRRTSANLNVHEFVNIMGPHMFWFHFKHITMQQISVACGKSRSSLPPIFHQPFDRWCTSAFAKVNALQCRLTLSLMQEHGLACKQEEENDAGLLFCRGKIKSLTL